MTNTSSKAIEYTIKIENDAVKQAACKLDDDVTTCPILSTTNMRYSYKIGNGSYSTPANLGNNNDIIVSGTISGKETIQVSVKIWIDSLAGNEIQGEYFFGQLVLVGEKSLSNN